MKERFGAKKAESMKLRTHAQTAGVSLTAQQPYNNVVRVALQALAAVLGGTQSLHTNSLDETYALPTEEAVTIALRTQQIIAEESGVANTIDPLGGSYFVEDLTDTLEREADGVHPPHRRDGRHGRARSRRATRSARSRRAPTASSARSSGRARDGRRQPLRGRARRRPSRSSASTTRCSGRRSTTSRKVKAERDADRCRAALSARARGAPGGEGQPDAADHRRRQGLLHASRRSATCSAR